MRPEISSCSGVTVIPIGGPLRAAGGYWSPIRRATTLTSARAWSMDVPSFSRATTL